MNKLKFTKGGRALVIVAHPDDETIWMGGTILKNKKLNWTIFSLCRLSDPDRAPKYFKVCKFYGAQAIMTDLEDDDQLSIERSVPVIKKLITAKIKNKKYDYIFTHGVNGEYGHKRHKGVNQAVTQLFRKGELKGGLVLCFNYVKASRKQFSPLKAGSKSDLVFKLTRRQFQAKKKIMTVIYGFDPRGIDANLCTNPEVFKILNVN